MYTNLSDLHRTPITSKKFDGAEWQLKSDLPSSSQILKASNWRIYQDTVFFENGAAAEMDSGAW